jgi:GNAT superfamily N-acetyltransferase
MSAPFHIRNARLPDDKPAFLGFIMDLQRFEHAIEPNRRVDDAVAEEYFASLAELASTKNGRILVAENGEGRTLGWAVAHEDESEVFVRADERINGYISELYVAEDMRGKGVGRALIAACEDWARERGLKVMMIGTLTRNTRAHAIYRDAGFTDYATWLRKYLR